MDEVNSNCTGEGGAGQAFLVRLENEDKLVVLKKV